MDTPPRFLSINGAASVTKFDERMSG